MYFFTNFSFQIYFSTAENRHKKNNSATRQGCSSSPVLFILAAELLAQKIRQNSKSKGTKPPSNVEVKLSQFADDTTLICKDIESLKENIMLINKFSDISGLKLNKKKTKAIWIGLQRKNKTRPLAIDITNEPTKTMTGNLYFVQS